MRDAWLAECYWPGVTERDVVVAAARVRARVPAGSVPDLSESILVVDDETVLCLFRGASIDAVHDLCRRVGLLCERAVRSRVVGSGVWAHHAGRAGVWVPGTSNSLEETP